MTSSEVEGGNGDNYISQLERGGLPFKASKYHDYFTSALPAQQKGTAPMLPVGTTAPVKAIDEDSGQLVRFYGDGLVLDQTHRNITTTATRAGNTNIAFSSAEATQDPASTGLK